MQVGVAAMRVYECWGGPRDGEHVKLAEGTTGFTVATPPANYLFAAHGAIPPGGSVRFVTHRYTVVGDMLVYRGTP